MRKSTKSKPLKKSSLSSSSKKAPRPEDYEIVLHWSDDDACYIATMPAWQNARTHGRTLEQATRNAHEVLTMFIASARREGTPCPEAKVSYSGNLRLRLPASLHERLAREAQREGVSLNQWLVARLAG